MNRFLTRPQLGRVTWWVQTQSHHPSIPFKQCSTRARARARATNVPSSKILTKLPEHVVPLTCQSSTNSGFCEVYLLGARHFSQKSCAELQAIVKFLKPEVIFLELCSSRKPGLMPSCSEFRVAYEEAIKYGGRVVLGDRPIQITLRRAWRKMPLQEKTRIFTGLFVQRSSRSSELLSKLLKEGDIDMDTVTHREQEMGEMFPTLWETLVHERDLYMSYTLLEVAKKSKCVVAVVGKGHLQGIKKHWEQPVLVEDLLKIPPPPKPAVSTIILTSVGVAVAGVSMIWDIFH